jgi:hypothetical protein
MTLGQIKSQMSISILKSWENDCEFWLWNAKAEGSTRGAKVWNTRLTAVQNRIRQILIS